MKPLSIVLFVSRNLESASYVVTDDESFYAVIDPEQEQAELLSYIADKKVDYILLTHGYYNHIGGVNAIKDKTDAAVAIHHMEVEYLANPGLNLSSKNGRTVACEWPDILLKGDELVQCGGICGKSNP